MKLSSGLNETIITFFFVISGLAANTNHWTATNIKNTINTSANATSDSGTTDSGSNSIPAKAARTTTKNGQSTAAPPTTDYNAAAAATAISKTATKCESTFELLIVLLRTLIVCLFNSKF